MMTAPAARRALTRKARAESIRSQVRAELARAAREERAAAELAEPVEAAQVPRPVRPALDAWALVWFALVMAAALPTVLRPAAGRLNRDGRRAARARHGCFAPYTADGSPPAHAPEACDASCHAGTMGVPPRPKLPYGGRRSRRWRDGPSLRLSQRIWRLTEDQCRCLTCVARAEIAAVRDLRPGEVPETPETRALHESDARRELALWQAVVWGPEAAAELARFRPDDRPADSVWARLRLALEALGLLRSQHDHGPPGLGGVVVLCHPRTGPPVARRVPEAPVICP